MGGKFKESVNSLTQACRFLHPENKCKEYMKNLKCVNKDCPDRHPRMWQISRSGCKRGEERKYHCQSRKND